MSGQQIGTGVGFIAGFFLPGGPQVWAGIGGLIGGAISPTQIEGPRLTDGMGVTAQEGVPNPWGFGSFSTGVNVLNAFDLREVREEDDGKGSGTEQVTYRYTRSFALGVCRAVRNADGTYADIAGVLRVTHNGKDVYNVMPDATSEQRANNEKFLEEFTIYLGGEDQLPDPTLEAYLGAGDASAYRGQVYIVGTDIDLTDARGAIGSWEVVVAMQGESYITSALLMGRVTNPSIQRRSVPSVDGISWEPYSPFPDEIATPIYISPFAGKFILWDSLQSYWTDDNGATYNGPFGSFGGVGGAHTAYSRTDVMIIPGGLGNGVFVTQDGESFTQRTGVTSNCVAVNESMALSLSAYDDHCDISYNDGASWTQGGVCPLYSSGSKCLSCSDETFVAGGEDEEGSPRLARTQGGSSWSFFDLEGSTGQFVSFVCPGPEGTWVALVETGEIWYSIDDGLTFVDSGQAVSEPAAGLTYNGSVFIAAGRDDLKTASAEDLEAWTTRSTGLDDHYLLAAIPPTIDMVNPGVVPLGAVVTEVCRRSGLDSSDIDVSALTQEVKGFKVANETTGEAILASLMPGYYFDMAEWDDKIRFVPRGGAPAFHLTVDDLVERDGPIIEETEVQEVELLRKVIVHAMDPTAGYVEVPQSWERRAATVAASGEQTIRIPVVMAPDEQRQVAQKRVKVGWTEIRRFAFGLPFTRPELTPTDCGTITDRAGRVQGIRLEQMTEDSGIIEIREAKLYRQSAYVSNAVGISHGQRPTTTPQPAGPTFFAAMNLPSLRTSDNVPGMYLAAAGYQRGWHGASIWLSTDGGASFQRVLEWPTASRMGTLTADIAESGEPLSVFMNSGTLSTITDDQLANRGNGFAITTDGVSEVGQFKTATLTGTQAYEATDIVRGGLGTDAAEHFIGDPFVMLSSVQFLPIDISHAGKTLIFKAVSYGETLDETAEYSVVFSPLFTSVSIESYVDEDIEEYVDENGQTYITEVSA